MTAAAMQWLEEFDRTPPYPPDLALFLLPLLPCSLTLGQWWVDALVRTKHPIAASSLPFAQLCVSVLLLTAEGGFSGSLFDSGCDRRCRCKHLEGSLTPYPFSRATVACSLLSTMTKFSTLSTRSLLWSDRLYI